MGKGEWTPANREAGFLVCGSSTAWRMLLSVGLSVSKAVQLYAVESGTAGLDSGSGFGVAEFAVEEAVCAGVSLFKATVFGCEVGLVTGGPGAGFLVSGVGEDAARGETGGLF